MKTRFKKGISRPRQLEIHKNALGVPERRTKPGYVLVQPRGQKWCTLITYTVTEQYRGGGTYQKSSGVLFESGRFQKCQ